MGRTGAIALRFLHFSRRACVAASLDGDFHGPPTIPGRERDRGKASLLETNHLATRTALEVSMAAAPKVLMPGGRIAPYPIVARELVRQTVGRQRFQYAIQRHAIDIVTALEPPFD